MSEFNPLESASFFQRTKSNNLYYLAAAFSIPVLILLSVVLCVLFFSYPPNNFPVNTAINIERGMSATAVVGKLEDENVVRSNTLLYLTLLAFHEPSEVKAGTYVFSEPLSVWSVASRLTEQAPPDTLMTLTLPEGYTVEEFANIAAEKLVAFDRDKFVILAENREGYLFPDTYYVPHDYTETELLNLLLNTHNEKLETLLNSSQDTSLDSYEILILASIIEREANTLESMQMVASVLLNRLEIGMALQADATMEYVLHKPLAELTPEDLKTDSPYNTYLYPGLPPTPIGNPGLTAVKAVLNPAPTTHFYYITDNDGAFYYAKTFDEHKQNIAKYLR